MKIIKNKRIKEVDDLDEELMKGLDLAQTAATGVKIFGATLTVFDSYNLAQAAITGVGDIATTGLSLALSVLLFTSAHLWSRQIKYNRAKLLQMKEYFAQLKNDDCFEK